MRLAISESTGKDTQKQIIANLNYNYNSITSFKKQKITKYEKNPIKPNLDKSTCTSLDVHWIRYKTSQ